jgi:hypothetical protein
LKGEYGGNIVYKYVNGKMRTVETISGMGEGGISKNDGGDEFNYDIY